MLIDKIKQQIAIEAGFWTSDGSEEWKMAMKFDDQKVELYEKVLTRLDSVYRCSMVKFADDRNVEAEANRQHLEHMRESIQ